MWNPSGYYSNNYLQSVLKRFSLEFFMFGGDGMFCQSGVIEIAISLHGPSTAPTSQVPSTPHVDAWIMVLQRIITLCTFVGFHSVFAEAAIFTAKYSKGTRLPLSRTMTCHATKIMASENRLECAHQCAVENCLGMKFSDAAALDGNCILCSQCSTPAAASEIFVTGHFLTLKMDLISSGKFQFLLEWINWHHLQGSLPLQPMWKTLPFGECMWTANEYQIHF